MKKTTMFIVGLLLVQSAAAFSQDVSKEDPQFDKQPEIVKLVQPVYPEVAKVMGLHGTIWVKVRVVTDGTVKDATITKGDSEVLGKAAIDAALSGKFKPATYKEKPVQSWIIIPFVFKLVEG